MRRTWWLALWLLAAPGAAWAQDAPSLQYRLTEVVTGDAPARLTLVAQDDLRQLSVTLTPEKGKARTFTVGDLGGGLEKDLDFPVPKGESRWRLSLAWTAGGGRVTSEGELTVRRLPPFDVQMSKHDVFLEEGRALARPNRPLGKAEVVVRDQTGNIVVERQVDLTETGPGQPVEVRWDMPAGSEARIADFRFYDQHQFWAAVRVVNFAIDIPHDDVVFETAKWDVRPDEAPKLDAAIAAVRKELTRFQRDLGRAGAGDVEGAVYVAGYTDTVGSAADNMALSERRARAIAEYFRAHGLGLAVYYQGFGEAALAVPTPDETDEARNRRAAYILASAPPSGASFPGARWKRLQ